MKSFPWLVIPLLSGLVIAMAGLFRHMQRMVYGEPPAGQVAVVANMWPVILHLLLVLWLGIAIPGVLVDWLNQATIMVVGEGVL